MTFTDQQMRVFLDRYAKRDKITNELIETEIPQLWQRVAFFLASAEETPELQEYWGKEFLKELSDFNVGMGGRINAGADAAQDGNLANCFFFENGWQVR